MDNSSNQHFASLGARRRVCEHCASTFFAGRSDQRFCTDLCRLRNWRSRKTAPSACAAGSQQRLDALLREIDRLEVQIAELRHVHAALREVLITCKCAQPSVDEPTRTS